MTTYRTDAGMKRRDEEYEFHRVEDIACDLCACQIQRSVDDPSVLWEPGPAWTEACTDRECRCHTWPLIGQRRND